MNAAGQDLGFQPDDVAALQEASHLGEVILQVQRVAALVVVEVDEGAPVHMEPVQGVKVATQKAAVVGPEEAAGQSSSVSSISVAFA